MNQNVIMFVSGPIGDQRRDQLKTILQNCPEPSLTKVIYVHQGDFHGEWLGYAFEGFDYSTMVRVTATTLLL